ncbi:MAG: hypothetical protein AAFV59_15650 [Pseudomonadota bacterium]
MSIQREFRESAILLGQQSGAVAGMMERGSVAAMNALAHEDQDAKQRRRDDDYQFLVGELQRIAQEIAKIDEKIDKLREHIEQTKAVHDDLSSGKIDVKAAMQTEAAKRAIQEWEKRTGKRFNPSDPNAEAILLDILAQQNRADQNEINGLEDLKERYKDIGREADARIQAGEDPAIVTGDVKTKIHEANDQYNAASTILIESRNEPIIETAKVEQDQTTDEMFGSEKSEARSAGALAGMLGSGPLADASAMIKADFSPAADPESNEVEAKPETELALATPTPE